MARETPARPQDLSKAPSHFVNTRTAAHYIGMSEQWLRVVRSRGPRSALAADGRVQACDEPPPFYRLGRSVRYALADLDAWLERHRVDPSRVGL